MSGAGAWLSSRGGRGDQRRRTREARRVRAPGGGGPCDRAYAAFNRHDWELNTYALHPDRYTFEAGEDDEGLLDLPRLLEGPAGYIQGMVRWQSAWSEITLLSEGVVDAGPGRLFNWARFVMQGSGSGIGLDPKEVEAALSGGA